MKVSEDTRENSTEFEPRGKCNESGVRSNYILRERTIYFSDRPHREMKLIKSKAPLMELSETTSKSLTMSGVFVLDLVT